MQRIIKGIGLRCLFCLLLAIGFISCGDEPVLNVSAPEGTEFLMSGGTKKIVVKSDGGWFLSFAWSSDDRNWLITSVTSGKGEQDIYVTALSNTSTETRSVVLTFTSSDDADVKAVLEFSQLGVANTLKLSSEEVTLAALPGNQRALKIESNMQWNVQTDQDWIKVSKSSGVGNEDIVISGDVNNGNERRGVLTISTANQSLTKQVIVIQKGLSDVIYQEPYTMWDATISDVKTGLNGFTLSFEDNNLLSYFGKYKESQTIYLFETGKLVQAVPVIQTTAANVDALIENLQNNGYVLGKNTLNGFPILLSHDSKNCVTIEKDAQYDFFSVRYRNYTRLFKEPYFPWGMSCENVKKGLANRGYVIIGEASGDGSDEVHFAGRFMEDASSFCFDVSQKLIYSGLFFDPAVVSVDQLRAYLTSNFPYSFVDEANDKSFYLYQSDDQQTKVLFVLPNNESKYILVIFMSSTYWHMISSQTKGQLSVTCVQDVNSQLLTFRLNRLCGNLMKSPLE